MNNNSNCVWVQINLPIVRDEIPASLDFDPFSTKTMWLETAQHIYRFEGVFFGKPTFTIVYTPMGNS